ncbi:rhomboid-like protein [Streptomyces aureus]|uniref:rhomboid-like protein n=1 Tax=Streptomyces aureus TaxID=193461 RepID=UPI003625508E
MAPAAAGPATGERIPPETAGPRRRMRPWRLLPTPTGTPFTFAYAAVLVGTSLFALFADPGVVASALRGSSTDAAHLAHAPVFVLVASALWIAGGITSPFAIGFLVVLTALERRIGGRRTAGVFVLGHTVATLATEVPVGLSVMAGHLPESSLHRLDYGISFGVAASIGALAGLLTPLAALGRARRRRRDAGRGPRRVRGPDDELGSPHGIGHRRRDLAAGAPVAPRAGTVRGLTRHPSPGRPMVVHVTHPL